MSPTETKVLTALSESFSDEDGGYLCFASICAETGLDRRQVRLACRSLKRKGLAKFAIGLWTEDGEARGAGYSATREGTEALAERSNV